jgi:hypothetical protein
MVARPVLPVSRPRRCPRISKAESVLKKDGRLFGVDRQLGLGFEAGYKSFLESGGLLNAARVPALILKGGNLQMLKGGVWHMISSAEVVLSDSLKSFIVQHVKFMDSQLASMQYTVLRVDADAGHKVQSHDLWGFFRGDRAPVRGHAPLEHKLVFGGNRFAAKVEQHKKHVKSRFLKQKGLAAQLLWVTQVAGHTEHMALHHKLLMFKKGGGWTQLFSSNDQLCDELSFEDAWGKCTKEQKFNNKRTSVVRVSQFLSLAGKSNWNVERSLQLRGLKNKRDYWRQPFSGGRGDRAPWVASESVLRRLWPSLTS